MRLRFEEFEKLMKERRWTNRDAAIKLGIEYSYFWRVKGNTRGVGKKFLTGLIGVLKEEGTRIPQFLEIENERDHERIVQMLTEQKLMHVLPLLDKGFDKKTERNLSRTMR